MVHLNKENIKNKKLWENTSVNIPEFDLDKMISKTTEDPIWVHFGAGNIFRGFIAALQQELLESGLAEKGIIAAETYDFEIIDRIYDPYDNMGILVVLYPDGSFSKKVIASISESLVGDPSRGEDWARLKKVFTNPSLQMASFTITEKGYNINQLSGEFLADVKKDMEVGPENPIHVMSKVASLAYTRYKNGQLPIAFVSMDNCAENGKRLSTSVNTIARVWAEKGLVEKEFIDYLNDSKKVSFPWSMIDKITPRPAEEVKNVLDNAGIGGMDIIRTNKNTFIAPFINAEGPQYLVIEDSFPNGRPPLEKAGVIFTDRNTVDRVEKMKVGTCLNPLHTALAIYGCLLDYKTIAQEMQDDLLRKLVEKIGLEEGMPVVINPGVIDPVAFAKEVIEVRLPNPYIPDTPQRIATDTSQKLKIRFGQTIAAYKNSPDLDAASLKYIPLVLAGWCRYLMGINDAGKEMTLSSDPMLETLKPYFADIKLGNPESAAGKLKPILPNTELFGVDLYEVGLGEKVEQYFTEMIAGENAVRNTLRKYLG
ncbi:MAG TPA: mannitol dehydrogenase family protein [Clostridiales bacterium]|mgnify:CR=1 FL=1|nr:mannitol dehydrogenase family protein [Clostridiales bacterium]